MLVPVFVAVFFSDSAKAYSFAVFIFLFAGFTDVLDGIIARKYHMITRLGRILDPLADKLMVFSALVCVSVRNLIPWWIAMIYLIKEVIQAVAGAVFFSKLKDMPSSNIIGKTATIIFYVAIATLVLFDNVSYSLKISLFLIALFFGVIAFATYYFTAVRIAAEKRRPS